MKVALIDGDIVAYRCAASCEKTIEKERVVVDPLDIAIKRANDLLHSILEDTGADNYRVFLTGPNNFRYNVYKDYKANRKDLARPVWLEDCREHLFTEWKAEMEEGFEADDLMGIYQTQSNEAPYKPMDVVKDETIICSIDKDLLQVPGQHYNFVKKEFYDINEVDGLRHFYLQLIMGDRSDNIPGYDGVMRLKVPKFLQPAVDELLSFDKEEDMDAYVQDMYVDKEQYQINKKLLWILREWPMQHANEME